MKIFLRIASLLIVGGIFGFWSDVSAQKKTNAPAQASAEAKASQTKAVKPKSDRVKQTRAVNLSKGNDRPPSEGESLTEKERIGRAAGILFWAQTFPGGQIEDTGSNLARTRGFIEQASDNAKSLVRKYRKAKNINEWEETSNWEPPYPDDMADVKNNLQQALDYLNAVEFETPQNNRAAAIELTERAIRQLEAYLTDPPAPKKARPTRESPTGTDPVKRKSGSQKVKKSGKNR